MRWHQPYTGSSHRVSSSHRFVCCLAATALMVCGAQLPAQVNDTSANHLVGRSERGITGDVTFEYSGPPLQAKVQRDAIAPMVLRLQRGSRPTEYRVRFIGNVSGQFDLRDWLEHVDGSPVTLAQPMTVQVVSTLPDEPRSDLFDAEGFQPSLTGGYRWVLALSALAWLAVPVIVVLRRVLTQNKQVALPTPVPELSLTDQIKPLIQSAAKGQLTIAEKARLELLLVHYFRQQARLPDEQMAHAIQQLRRHAQAGPILEAVEQWLHAEASSTHGNPDAQNHAVQSVLRLLERLPSEVGESESIVAGSATP